MSLLLMCVRKTLLQIYASMLWKIHDYSGYGEFSEWSTKGKLTGTVYHGDIGSIHLEHDKKERFMRH